MKETEENPLMQGENTKRNCGPAIHSLKLSITGKVFVDPQAYANLRETREEAQIASSSMSVYSFTSYPEMKGERF